jgi:hypothetical protein
MTRTRRYWYRRILYYCPSCGRGHAVRYRTFKKPRLRLEIVDTYDWCDG